MKNFPSPGELALLLTTFDSYLPIIKVTIDKFAPELGEQLKRINQFHAETQIESFEFYLNKGFTREEAMMLVLNAKIALQDILKNSGGNKK